MKKPDQEKQTAPYIQAVSAEDYPSLRQLALKYPLLNLPAEEKLLKEKIENSLHSFNESLPKEKRNFLFVLKAGDGEVIGSSQISAKSGTNLTPSYSLKISEDQSFKDKFLQLKKITNGPSYLGGLILDSSYRGRKEQFGKQLSLIRLLFAGLSPHFFEDTFHAEVAPFLDPKGQNPFFEQFIKKHISLSMQEIDYLTLTDKEKLFANYPRGKIKLADLPEPARRSLGKPGLFSQRASSLLEKQGFRFVHEVDPFDGGPYWQAKSQSIPIIQNIQKARLKPANTSTSCSTKQKWLFALLDKSNFKGGVLNQWVSGDGSVFDGGSQRGDKLPSFFISSDELALFQLEPDSIVFVSPFV